jgi:hypothetical protein
VAVGTKRKKSKSGSGWNWRLVGIALCAFFALGVITGLSTPGRSLARRIEALLGRLSQVRGSELIPPAYGRFIVKTLPAPTSGWSSPESPNEAIALAKRPEGFYQIDSKGNLFGPLAPTDAADLPVLGGSEVEHASSRQVLEYAEELIRAEAALGASISEMHVTADDRIHFYLDRPRFVVITDEKELALQLSRAAKVLSFWRHCELLGMIDMTVPDEAIVRVGAEELIRRNDASVIPAGSRAHLNFHRQRAAVAVPRPVRADEVRIRLAP